jgi:PAS domain S-box-containing protein
MKRRGTSKADGAGEGEGVRAAADAANDLERARLAAIVDSTDDAIISKTLDGEITSWNAAAERLYGYTAEEVIGRHISVVVPPELRGQLEEIQTRLRSEGAGTRVETARVRKDGSRLQVAVTVSPVRDAAGNVVGASTIARDITEIKAAKQELARRVRQGALVADVGFALALGRASTREVLQRCCEAVVRHLDAAFARIWTLAPGADVLELQASAGLYTHLDGAHGRVPVGKFKIGLIAAERKSHLTNSVVGDPRVGDQEWAKREGMVAFAGYPLLVEDRLAGVLAMFSRAELPEDTLGTLSSVSNVVAQSIERRRAEEAARESVEQLRTLADSIPQLAWMADETGSIFWYNRRWYDYTGTTPEEMEGRGWQKVHHPEEVERVTASFNRAVAAGEPWEETFPLRGEDGEFRRFLSRAVPVRDAGGHVVRWFGTNTDVEEQKQVEALLERLNEERERMLEEVSTPVVPVMEGVLVLPLIGSLDSVRAERATRAALTEVTRQGARACILDITGARMVDSHAVAHLTNLVQALKLVGADAYVTGVGAQVAQTLVSLGLDMQGLRTFRTLAQALSALSGAGGRGNGWRA